MLKYYFPRLKNALNVFSQVEGIFTNYFLKVKNIQGLFKKLF
jgi:hypothetical protein